MGHHIWCNFFRNDPETCPLCERLKKEYPETTEEEMIKKYFPSVIVKTKNYGTKENVQKEIKDFREGFKQG